MLLHSASFFIFFFFFIFFATRTLITATATYVIKIELSSSRNHTESAILEERDEESKLELIIRYLKIKYFYFESQKYLLIRVIFLLNLNEKHG